MGAYVSSKADPFFTISGGLTGIISVAAGMDLYHPALVIVIAFACAWIMPKVAAFIEKMGVDDVVGAVSVHGVTGIISGILPGIFAAGYIAQKGQAPINLLGQIGGVAISAILLGFIPGYLASLALKKFNLLRVPPEVETRRSRCRRDWASAPIRRRRASPAAGSPPSCGKSRRPVSRSAASAPSARNNGQSKRSNDHGLTLQNRAGLSRRHRDPA